MTMHEKQKDDFEQLFEDMADVFLELKIQKEPSEVHGVLVGMLVRTDGKDVNDWVELLELIEIDTSVLDDRAKAILQDVYVKTRSALASDEYEFQLLMPADDYELGERASALAVWSSGFISGFGLASKHKAALDSNLVELLNHLHSISQLDDQLGESEENEKDLYELYEYVRLGVLTLRQAAQEDVSHVTSVSNKQNKTLH
jgi:uncharacterized protein YgfB (UPF0149 family)